MVYSIYFINVRQAQKRAVISNFMRCKAQCGKRVLYEKKCQYKGSCKSKIPNL